MTNQSFLYKTFTGHSGAITCMSTDPEGKVLFTGSTDQLIYSWNILKGERLKLFEGHQGSIICMQIPVSSFTT